MNNVGLMNDKLTLRELLCTLSLIEFFIWLSCISQGSISVANTLVKNLENESMKAHLDIEESDILSRFFCVYFSPFAESQVIS